MLKTFKYTVQNILGHDCPDVAAKVIDEFENEYPAMKDYTDQEITRKFKILMRTQGYDILGD